MNELRTAYRATAHQVPPLGDVDAALRVAARRRRRIRVVVPVLAASCVVASLAVAQTRWDLTGRAPRIAATPSQPTTSIAGDAPTWPPTPIVRGGVRVAPVGTLMYSTCAQNDVCSIRLMRPGGSSIALDAVWPAMAERLRTRGLGGATLSYDASWLGIATARGYAVYGIGAAAGFTVHGAGDSPWVPASWTLSSAGLAVVQRGATQSTYAEIELGGGPGWRVTSTDPSLVPVGNGADSIQVVRPGLAWARTNVRITSLDIQQLIGRSSQYRLGSVHRFRSSPLDLGGCLRPDESLLGPAGIPVLATPPAGATLQRYDESNAVVAFRETSRGRQPSAVLRMTCASDAEDGRYELPRSTGSTTWSLLAPITSGDSLMTRLTAGSDTKDVYVVGLRHRPRRVGSVPATAQVLVPGGALSLGAR